jgi:hypothetical protein
MNRLTIFLFVVVVTVYTSCNVENIKNSHSTKQEMIKDTWETIQQSMASGADVNGERPLPNVLSEQEVLIKAVDYARHIGAFSPTYYVYQENPALLTAKLETPVLIYDISTGTMNIYSLTAVDNDGTDLMTVYVSSSVDTAINNFEHIRIIGLVNVPEQSIHRITKREAIRLMKNQFSEKQMSDPIAITGLYLEDSPYSNNHEFWYFTVSDQDRSISEIPEEYIIASEIVGWKKISGGLSNRAAISSGDGGSPHLNWNRMAKLETPLRLFQQIEEKANRAAAESENFAEEPIVKVRFTPVPLK